MYGLELGLDFQIFRLDHTIRYDAFCDDFGPMDLSSIVDFSCSMDRELAHFPEKKIVFCADTGRRALTNAVFLLGAYMVIRQRKSPDQVAATLSCVDPTLLEPYRDASFSRGLFRLRLVDCWRGLDRARRLGWVRHGAAGHLWGAVDVDEHRHYARPANGCIRAAVPGRVFLVDGPRTEGAEGGGDGDGADADSTAALAAALLDLGVRTLIQLQGPADAVIIDGGHSEIAGGGRDEFASRGVRRVCLQCDTGLGPFLAAAAAAEPGDAVAVRSPAGGGAGQAARGDGAGELAALHLMGAWGFGAREALAWLRVVRPGSVAGERAQRFLCAVDAARYSLRSSGGGRVGAAAGLVEPPAAS